MPVLAMFSRPSRLDAHQRIVWSLAAGVLVYAATTGFESRTTQFIAAWDAFVLVELALAWTAILQAHPEEIRRTVRLQDTGRTLIFVLVVLAACAAFGAIALVLGPVPLAGPLPIHLPLSIAAIIGSWLLMHTMFALRYAHLYYSGTSGDIPAGTAPLLFPSEHRPDYLDFAYFSFVIGMTSQVSDVQISSRRLRRLALVHGMIAFGFNTMILALTINVVSNVIQRG